MGFESISKRIAINPSLEFAIQEAKPQVPVNEVRHKSRAELEAGRNLP